MSKLEALAKINLDPSNSAHQKSSFLSAYGSGIYADPSLIEHGIYRLVVKTVLDEDPKHTDVREKAAALIATVLMHHPDWADHRLADPVTDRLLEPGKSPEWAIRIYTALREHRPELVASSEQAVTEAWPGRFSNCEPQRVERVTLSTPSYSEPKPV